MAKNVENHQTQAFFSDFRGCDWICELHRPPFILGSSIPACQPVALGNLCLFWGLGSDLILSDTTEGLSWSELQNWTLYWKVNHDLVQSERRALKHLWSISTGDRPGDIIHHGSTVDILKEPWLCVFSYEVTQSHRLSSSSNMVIFINITQSKNSATSSNLVTVPTYNYSQRLSLTGFLSPHTKTQNWQQGSIMSFLNTGQKEGADIHSLLLPQWWGSHQDWPCLSII